MNSSGVLIVGLILAAIILFSCYMIWFIWDRGTESGDTEMDEIDQRMGDLYSMTHRETRVYLAIIFVVATVVAVGVVIGLATSVLN